MIGRIHSFETFGTLDGPGIRFVLFMQGCVLRCQYCHNPDSWDIHAGTEWNITDIQKEIRPFLNYYQRSGGGITVTGGEPTLQSSFLNELFRTVKAEWNMHTALDTAGYCEPSQIESLIQMTDLVLFDIKTMDSHLHQQLVGQSNERILHFCDWLTSINKDVWIRHVVVPGLTDSYEQLHALGSYLKNRTNVKKIELLPYHRMGVYKWQELHLQYPLDGFREPKEQEMVRARTIVDQARYE